MITTRVRASRVRGPDRNRWETSMIANLQFQVLVFLLPSEQVKLRGSDASVARINGDWRAVARTFDAFKSERSWLNLRLGLVTDATTELTCTKERRAAWKSFV